MQFSTGVPRTVRSFSAIACSILRVFRKVISDILRHLMTVKFPDFRQSRLFEFEMLWKIRHRGIVDASGVYHFHIGDWSRSNISKILNCRSPMFPISRFSDICFFYLFTMALKDTTPGRCRRLRRLPIPHRRLIQEQNSQIPKFSKTAPEEFWNPDRPPSHHIPSRPGIK